MSFHADRLREVQSFYRLPGFVFTESLMAFWKCSRSTAAHRLKKIHERNLAVVRSESLPGGKRWYWIDPYLPIDHI